MADNSKIEWCDATWNFIVGCTKVSPGCDNCYAERDVNRWNGPGAFDTVVIKHEKLQLPLQWRRPRRIFVNSLSDLWHEAVSDDVIAQSFAVMALTRRHTYQILTKRHSRMRSLLSSDDFRQLVAEYASGIIGNEPPGQRRIEVSGVGDGWSVIGEDLFGGNIWAPTWPLPNVWLGVSVEDQKWADIRVSALANTPAAVRFLSCEPLLGPVHIDFRDIEGRYKRVADWVIVGGESGPGARPMHPDWVRQLRDECAAAGVPFFFKQAGAVLAREWGCSDRKGHNPDEWPEPFPREMPTWSAVSA